MTDKELLDEYRALHKAYLRTAWHPTEPPPAAVLAWLNASSLLLSFCAKLLEKAEEDR